MKKTLAILLALCMVMAFAACGADNTENTTAAPETTGATVPTVEAQFGLEETLPADAELIGGEVEVMTHEEFMAAEADEKVCIETYVQATRSWWDNSICVYAQSPDGGYFIYDMVCSEEDAAKLVPGTKIRVTGVKAIYDGLHEINKGATFEFVEDADPFIAEAFDATALLGTEELEKHMSEFASFKGLSIEKIEYKNGEPGDDIYVTVGYNGASYDFCVEVYLTGTESEVYKTVGELKVGDIVNVEGFLYWYKGVNTHITAIAIAE